MARALAVLPLLFLLLGSSAAEESSALVSTDEPSGLCETCLLSMRFMEDALCDADAVGFIVETAKKQLCPVLPDQQQCTQLAETLLPVAVEWLRSSATPASLCSAVGVCGTSLLGDFAWDKPPARLVDGLECPLCKHVVATAKADAGLAEAGQDVPLQASVLSACGQLPQELATACISEFDKRGALLRLAMGVPTVPNGLEPCELMGMCVARLGRRRPPPLAPDLVRQLAVARPGLGSAYGRLAAAIRTPALRDNRCDMCKLTMVEVTALFTSPGFQDSVRAYAESFCDATVPAAYSAACRQYVDAYTPLLFSLLRQHLAPDEVCVRLRLCARPSVWQEILMGMRRRGGLLGRVLGARE